MKKFLFLIAFCITTLFGFAQSAELKAALEQVNKTLKEYALGANEFRPYYFKENGSIHGEYKVIRFSYDYPNLIFDYTIVTEGGWSTNIHNGVYSVAIPITSSIEYPKIEYDYNHRPNECKHVLVFKNENGITKKINGKASIITSFEIFADSELTAKKFASELGLLKDLLVSEGYQGKLGGKNLQKSSHASANNGSKTSSNQTTTSKKVGKYVQ